MDQALQEATWALVDEVKRFGFRVSASGLRPSGFRDLGFRVP